MYLKALEIQGFKSFPDKTVLTFGEAITAVVGPNGSGKSNIADAIRWVMGEQSTKALRGGKMEDVIFGGTLKRKPLGYAQVSLVLDNREKTFALEEQEVMVTRRYFRSGDSEYYINRRSCRLRDIHELFMDTGLGKEGYSIIGQGKIDEILSTKGTERRAVFEEAAGISRYRYRKEEAQRKLERTDDNLMRVGDKIAELELQLEPLRVQAEKARQYLTYREELRGLEVSLWLTQLDQLRMTHRKLLSDYETAVLQREEASRIQETLYSWTEALGQEMRQRESSMEALRLQGAELDKALQQQESAAAVLESRIKNNAEEAQRLEQELNQQQGRADTAAQQAAQYQERLKQIQSLWDAGSLQIQVMEKQAEQAEQNAGDLKQELDALRSREEQYLKAAAQARESLSALTAAAQEVSDRNTAREGQILSLDTRIAQAETVLLDGQKQLNGAKEQGEELRNMLEGCRLRLESWMTKERQETREVQRLTLEGQGLDNRIQMLSEMEKMYEGYSGSVKLIMRAAGRDLQGVHGPAADLLQVPDAYTTAIETALGGAKQYLVVDTEEDGRRAIQYLKHRDGGRATFLPLTAIRPNRLREQGVEQCAGFVGVASELITCQERYKAVFARLLGNVVIAEDLNCAIPMAKRYQYRFKIVTLDGQVLYPGGSMTGGSSARNAGILSRAGELKRLRTRRKTLTERETAARERQMRAEQERSHAEADLGCSEKQLRGQEEEILRLEKVCNEQTVLLAQLRERRQSEQSELEQFARRGQKLEEETDAIQSQIADLQKEAEALRAQRKGKNLGREDVQDRREAIRQELAQYLSERAALEAERSATCQALEQLLEMKRMLSGDQDSRRSQLEECRRRAKQFRTELEEVRTRTAELQEQQRAQTQRLRCLVEERLELEGQRESADRAARQKNQELLNMERECSVLEQKKAAAALEEKQLLDRLWERYELTYDSAKPLQQELESPAKAGRRIGELKRSIRGLGSVHAGAVEEYQRVNERYEYLSEQRNDVIRAKTELEGIIGALTTEMEKIFAVQFRNISKTFEATFLELFGGGKASLELEDESDLLGCGIEIKVQPPGKTLKNLSLLSGGEKAFVAIALYFAFLKIRPTPFVVMDEIEAALDESNVVRFARYLRSLSAKTQFIIITHRRGAMEEADVLYGVTMQERGISKILTINLNDVERELHLNAT